MRRSGGLRHLLGLTVLLLLVVVPATASAATTVRVFHASYAVVQATPLVAPPVTVGAHGVVHFRFAPGYPVAGVQGTSPGLQGTSVTLPACAGACTDRYLPASSAPIAAGHYAERVIFTVTQPRNAGPAVGFDLEIAVHLTTGWVSGSAYFSTGVATGAATSTITLRVYVDLGAALPTATAVLVTDNRCLSTAACP